MKRLGVNIDHVATIRNARGETHPEPIKAAKLAIKHGANSVTIHLREDRRHIRDKDLIKISKNPKIPLNLEIADDKKILKIALKNKPNFICLVPEKRKEITTEGGLNLINNYNKLKNTIDKIKKAKIRTSLFINPNINDIKIAKKINTDCIELHTGKYCNKSNTFKNNKKEFREIKKAASYAKKNSLEVHAGHGLTYKTAKEISKIDIITEFNIGHFIVSESIFIGLKKAIFNFKRILNNK